MVQYCVAYGCKEASRKGTSVSFHSFPRDENLRNKWILNLRRENFQASKYSRVCSKHFAPECFELEAFGKGRKLRKDSIPTIFDFSKELQGSSDYCKRIISTNLMECNDNTIVDSENCVEVDEPRIKEDYHQNEISTVSKKSHLQQPYFMKCDQSSDTNTVLGIKQEIWDPIEESGPEQSSLATPDLVTFEGSGTLAVGDGIVIKEENFNQEETTAESQKPYLQQSETWFFKCHDSDVDTKIEIKQEPWYPNVASGPEEPEKGDGEINIKEEPWWCDRKSNDSHNEEKESGSKKKEEAEDVPLYKSSRPYTEAEFSSGATELQKNESISLGANTGTLAQRNEEKFEKQKHKIDNNCKICKKSFILASQLKRHLLTHDDKKKLKCELCGKSYRLRYIKEHILIHDDKQQDNLCEICGKSFKFLPYLKKHLLTHDDERKYKCEICGKHFKFTNHLKQHLSIHDDKRQHKCDICGKSFKLIQILKDHLLIHDDYRKHKCGICGKGFKMSRHLKGHLLIHDDKKQYNCEICRKDFRLRQHLKRHILIHDYKKIQM